MKRKNQDDEPYFKFFYKIRGFVYFCLLCGFVSGVGGISIGILEGDKGVFWSSLSVLIVALYSFFYLKKSFKRGHF